jgi:hypothetical protein
MGRWMSYNFRCECCEHNFSTIVDLNLPDDPVLCPKAKPEDPEGKHKVVKMPNAFAIYDVTGHGSSKRKTHNK